MSTKVKNHVIGDVEYLLNEIRKLDDSIFDNEPFLRSIDCAIRALADVRLVPRLRIVPSPDDAT